MQPQVARQEDVDHEELNDVKAQLSVVERDKHRAFEELKEIKLRLSTVSREYNEELSCLKESLENAARELKSKEKTIESLQAEVEKVRQFELNLTGKDDELKTAEQQFGLSKSPMSQRDGPLSVSQDQLEELEAELERRMDSEAKLLSSLVNQTNQLQEASFLIEKHRLEAASLREKMEALDKDRQKKDEVAREEVERLRNEIMAGTIETKTLLNEIEFLKNELKRAMEEEENKDKAMEELALVLKEVTLESNRTKEKLLSTEHQLEAVKEEAANLKKMVELTEESYEALLNEQKKQNDCLTNIVNRLRLEAEESLLAWSGKEIEFVKCIKKAEHEKNVAEAEISKLLKLDEESKPLRDLVQQALDEANEAKEAASLANSENSYLKESLAEKDKALISLAQETERLRINEAEANESIKELRRVLTSGSKKEVAKLEKECKELKKVAAKKEPHHGADTPEKEPRERKLSSTFSFDLGQLLPSIPGMTHKSSKDLNEDRDGDDDVLGGSIFDLVESPEKDPPPYHRRTSSACSSTDERISLAFDSFDDDSHFDDMEIERSSHVKKKALLRRFGDLLRRKNSHPPKDLPHPPKDVAQPPKEITA